MDLQLIIAVNVMAINAMLVTSSLRYRANGYVAWIAVNVMVASISALCLWLVPDAVGWIAGALLLIFVLLPASLSTLAMRLSERKYGKAAERVARLATISIPGPNARFNLALGQAMAATGPGEVSAALERLEAEAKPNQKPMVRAYLAVERGDWASALAAARELPTDSVDLKSTEIRALAELGRIDEMAQVYERAKPRLLASHLHYAQLVLFVFTGKITGLTRLFDGPMRNLDGEIKSYWLSLARVWAAPENKDYRRKLEHLAATAARDKTRLAATRHLAQAHTGVQLSPETQAIASAAERRIQQDAMDRLRPILKCPVTLALIVANAVVFAAEEWLGSSTTFETLVQLGALWPPYVVERDEWWRLLTTAFLHYGWLHFGINMFMLLQLGRIVESRFGSFPMLMAYLWCAIASTAAVTALMWFEVIDMNPLVGASGAIFGLLGIETARLVGRWLKSRDALDQRRLMPLAIILVLQTAVDFSIPNVSWAAHAAGFVSGIVAGLILLVWRRALVDRSSGSTGINQGAMNATLSQ